MRFPTLDERIDSPSARWVTLSASVRAHIEVHASPLHLGIFV